MDRRRQLLLLGSALVPPAPPATPIGAPVNLGTAQSTTNVSSVFITTAIDVPAGATVIILAGLASSGAPTASDGTNAFTAGTPMSDTEYVGRVAVLYRHYPAGLATGATITLNTSVTGIIQMSCMYVTGLASTSPVDQQTVGNSGAASTAFTTVASAALSQANCLAIGFGRIQSGGSDAALTQPGGWTAIARATAGTGEVALDGGYQITSTTAALTYAATLANARNWTAGLVIFKGA